jgi:2-methylisocitrate lyase-like PEP mutase family enzyme
MNSSQIEKAARFRALHDRPGPFVIPNPWDVASTRILEGMGFEAVATSSAASACAVGRRDGELTRDEALAHARMIVNATDLPVSADLERGFGDVPDTVAETIRLAAEVGLVGCTIEDTTGNPDKPVYDFSLAVERIAAAAQAAQAVGFPFLLTARAHNLMFANPNLDETINRLQAFERAGSLQGLIEASQFHGGHQRQVVFGCRTSSRGSKAHQPRHFALSGGDDPFP